MKKYYFISYSGFAKGFFNSRWEHCSELIDIRPLQWQIENFHIRDCVVTLHSWQEITEAEYNEYKRMNNQIY